MTYVGAKGLWHTLTRVLLILMVGFDHYSVEQIATFRRLLVKDEDFLHHVTGWITLFKITHRTSCGALPHVEKAARRLQQAILRVTELNHMLEPFGPPLLQGDRGATTDCARMFYQNSMQVHDIITSDDLKYSPIGIALCRHIVDDARKSLTDEELNELHDSVRIQINRIAESPKSSTPTRSREKRGLPPSDPKLSRSYLLDALEILAKAPPSETTGKPEAEEAGSHLRRRLKRDEGGVHSLESRRALPPTDRHGADDDAVVLEMSSPRRGQERSPSNEGRSAANNDVSTDTSRWIDNVNARARQGALAGQSRQRHSPLSAGLPQRYPNLSRVNQVATSDPRVAAVGLAAAAAATSAFADNSMGSEPSRLGGASWDLHSHASGPYGDSIEGGSPRSQRTQHNFNNEAAAVALSVGP